MLKKFFFKIWPILVILVLVFIFFWQFFLKGLVPIPADVIVGIYYPWRDHVWNNLVAGVPFKNGLLSDIVSIIYPWRIYGVELLKNGNWPLWIPQALAGTPLLANFQSGLFYPLNFLFWIFSNTIAWSLYIILQPILASIFCFLFLKNHKLSSFSALIGSIIFAFSGFSLVWFEYGVVGHAGLWLPIIFLAIDKLFEKFSFGWLIAGALAVGFSILAGYPQISFLVFLASAFYTIYKFFSSEKSVRRKAAVYIFFIFVLGIFISAVQIFPGLELWQLSIRSRDPTAAAFNFGLNPLKNLVLFLVPDFYGNPATGNFWGWGAYNESASYVSIAGLLLAIIALFSFTKERNLTFFRFLLLFSLLIVFANPLSNLIFNSNLPILASSSAGRFLFLTDFSLAVLIAFGTELLMKKIKLKLLYPLVPFVIVFLFILFIVFLRPEIWPDRNLITNLAVSRRNLILPTIFIFSSLVLFLLTQLKKFSIFRKLIFVLILFLIVFDLFRFGWKYVPFTSKDYLYPETRLTNFLKNQGDLYRFTGLIPQSMFIPYNLSSPEGYEPLMIRRYSEFANRVNEETFSQISTGSRWVIVNRRESPLLKLLGIKYFLSFNSDPKSNWDPQYFQYSKEKYEMVFQYGKSQIYENREVLPRAFIVHDFRILNDEEILKTLMREDFDPTQQLLLEENPQNTPEKKIADDQVKIDQDSYLNNNLSLVTKSASDGFLFLSDAFYPGWRASVDGKETKIYRADYAFRALFLPKGEHLVKFVYDPQSFRIGLWFSAISFVILIALGIYAFLKR